MRYLCANDRKVNVEGKDKKNYGLKQHRLGFWQIDPAPAKEELEAYYAKTYFQTCSSATYAPEYTEEERRYFHNRPLIAWHLWKRFGGRNEASLIDVGCGEGFFAGWFAGKGWKARACDFSSCGIERHNLDLLPCFKQGDVFETLRDEVKSKAKYDLVNLSNVIEHVIDPIGLLQMLKSLLHEGSMLRVAVPNDFSRFQELLVGMGYLKEESWLCPPDHLNYFTFSTFRAALEDAGFSVRLMMADFPIETYLMNGHSNYWLDRSRGKEAHLSRVRIDNFLVDAGLDAYINYMSGAAECGLGRSAIAFVSLKR